MTTRQWLYVVLLAIVISIWFYAGYRTGYVAGRESHATYMINCFDPPPVKATEL